MLHAAYEHVLHHAGSKFSPCLGFSRVADARLGKALAPSAQLHVVGPLGISVRQASSRQRLRWIARLGRRRCSKQSRGRHGRREALSAADRLVCSWGLRKAAWGEGGGYGHGRFTCRLYSNVLQQLIILKIINVDLCIMTSKLYVVSMFFRCTWTSWHRALR